MSRLVGLSWKYRAHWRTDGSMYVCVCVCVCVCVRARVLEDQVQVSKNVLFIVADFSVCYSLDLSMKIPLQWLTKVRS